MPKPANKEGAIPKSLSIWTENYANIEKMAVDETRGNFSLAANIALSAFFANRAKAKNGKRK